MKIKLSELKKIIREELNEADEVEPAPEPYLPEDADGWFAMVAVEEFNLTKDVDPENFDDLEDAFRGRQHGDLKAFYEGDYKSYLEDVAEKHHFDPDVFGYFVTLALEKLV